MFSIVASIAVPNALFVVSLSILLYWYCPYCQAKCRKYEEQVDQDEREYAIEEEAYIFQNENKAKFFFTDLRWMIQTRHKSRRIEMPYV